MCIFRCLGHICFFFVHVACIYTYRRICIYTAIFFFTRKAREEGEFA